jgi:hypothetical protein
MAEDTHELQADRGELVDEFVDGLFLDEEVSGYTREALAYANFHDEYINDPEGAMRDVRNKVEWLYELLDRINLISDDISGRLLEELTLDDFEADDGSYQVERVLDQCVEGLLLKGDEALPKILGERFTDWFENKVGDGDKVDSNGFVYLRLIVEISDALEEFSDIAGLEVDLMLIGILDQTFDEVRDARKSPQSIEILKSFQRSIASLKGEKNHEVLRMQEAFALYAEGYVSEGRRVLSLYEAGDGII